MLKAKRGSLNDSASCARIRGRVTMMKTVKTKLRYMLSASNSICLDAMGHSSATSFHCTVLKNLFFRDLGIFHDNSARQSPSAKEGASVIHVVRTFVHHISHSKGGVLCTPSSSRRLIQLEFGGGYS